MELDQDSLYRIIIKNIKRIRKENNINARDLSIALDKNKDYITKIESGNNKLSLNGMLQIMRYFDRYSPQDFFVDNDTGDEEPEPPLITELIENAKKLDRESQKILLELITNFNSSKNKKSL